MTMAFYFKNIFHRLFDKHRLPKAVFLFVFFVHAIVSLMTLKENSQFVLQDDNIEPIKLRIKQTSEVKQQIVNTEKTKSEIKPKETRFLSQDDQSVAREVVAKNVDSFKKGGLGVENGQEKPSVDQREQQKSEKEVKKIKNIKDLALSDLAVKPTNQEVQQRSPSVASPKLGSKSGDKNESGLSSSNDFIEDIELGDMTELNTVRLKYFSFYERIRKKLEQYWGASIQEKARKLFASGSRFPASKNYITSVKVTMDREGKIIGINIQGSSGIKDLDDAAVESFNQAGPFPNPPQDLIKNGRATIEWGFVVKG